MYCKNIEKKKKRKKGISRKQNLSPVGEFKTTELETSEVILQESQSIKEDNYEKPEWGNWKKNSLFLLDDFLGGKRYVCAIQNIDEETGKFTLVEYRRCDKFSTEFKVCENDISISLTLEIIVAISPVRNIG